MFLVSAYEVDLALGFLDDNPDKPGRIGITQQVQYLYLFSPRTCGMYQVHKVYLHLRLLHSIQSQIVTHTHIIRLVAKPVRLRLRLYCLLECHFGSNRAQDDAHDGRRVRNEDTGRLVRAPLLFHNSTVHEGGIKERESISEGSTGDS